MQKQMEKDRVLQLIKLTEKSKRLFIKQKTELEEHIKDLDIELADLKLIYSGKKKTFPWTRVEDDNA